jgi:hypothetical protein
MENSDSERIAEMLLRLGMIESARPWARAWEVRHGDRVVGVEVASPFVTASCEVFESEAAGSQVLTSMLLASGEDGTFFCTRGDGTTFYVAQTLPARLVDEQALRDMVDAVARRAGDWSVGG